MHHRLGRVVRSIIGASRASETIDNEEAAHPRLCTGDRYVRIRRTREPSRPTTQGSSTSYDAATKTLTIKRKDKQGEFVITDTSEVLQGKTKADASAFTAGQKVDVEFVMDGAEEDRAEGRRSAAPRPK